MDAGGYSNKAFWNYPINTDGKEIGLPAAMTLFVDHTGRQGPTGWEAGTYPDGQGKFSGYRSILVRSCCLCRIREEKTTNDISLGRCGRDFQD